MRALYLSLSRGNTSQPLAHVKLTLLIVTAVFCCLSVTQAQTVVPLKEAAAIFEPKVVNLLEPSAAPAPSLLIPAPSVVPAPAPVSVPASVPASAPVIQPLALPLTAPYLENNLWQRLRRGFAMPNLDTQLAQDKTAWYAKQPDYIARMTQRGGQYLFHIIEELEKRGMPTELALLPFIESAFNPQAVSSAKAAGMWQFMPATGKYFNLKQNVWRDERRGVVESTRAALDYLQKLHGMFGDWHLALAAYNWGEGSVQRAINKNRAKGLPTDYVSLNMPNETAHYVPKFQAMKNIVQSPENYGITLANLDNSPFFASVVKTRDIDVNLAAQFAGMSISEFRALNPGFKKPVILGANKPEILLPANKLDAFNIALDNHKGALSSWTTVTLAGTEKPAHFAKRYGVSEQVLRDVNNIPPRMLIKPGSTLVVPKQNAQANSENISAKLDDAQINLAPELVRRGLVARKGDSWARIAKRTGMSVASLREWNRASGEPKAGARITYYTASGGSKKRASASHSARGKSASRKSGGKRVVTKTSRKKR